MSYENLERFQGSPNIDCKIYDKVFEGEIDCNNLEEIYELVRDTVRTVYPKYYPQEIVDFFCGIHNRESIQKDIEEVDDQIRVHNICKSKFNGELVMQLTNLTGKELGGLMKLLKPLTTDDVVYNMNEQEIKNLIVDTYANFKYV